MHYATRDLLRDWLARQLPADAMQWLHEKATAITGGAPDRDIYLAVSLVSRKIGKADLALSEADLADAEATRAGWDPTGWSADQAARLVLVLGIPDSERMAGLVDQLCLTGDVAELVSFHHGLPLYPEPSRYLARAREGARSNMKAVFEAVAHANPYPAENFDELAWNHMVLKALFIGAALHPIQRLDERANPALMRMLCDYAHERWAAGRPVSPELWRCVGRHADDEALADLKRVLLTGSTQEKKAAALALHDSPRPEAIAMLEGHGDLTAEIAGGRLTWNDIRPN